MSGNPDYWAGFVVGAAGVLIILRVLDWLKARKDRRHQRGATAAMKESGR